jgi:ABC-type sugar transport system substrate-binding protein
MGDLPVGVERWADDYLHGQLSRRGFIRRMAIAGMSLTAIYSVLNAVGVAAQSPSASVAPVPSATPLKTTTSLKTLGFSHPYPGSGIYRGLRKGLRAEGERLGVETLESTAEGQADKQLAEINTWIDTIGVEAVSILNINGEGLGPTVDHAHEQGVKVIGYAFNIDGEDGYNVFDNIQGAELVAAAAIDWINENVPEGEVQMGLLTLDTIQVGFDRVHHAEELIKAAIPRVVTTWSAEGTNLAAPAQEATLSQLQANPDTKVIIAISDDGQYGAWQAMKQLGMDQQIWSAGYDGLQEVMEAIVAGELIGVTAAIPLVDIGAANVWVAANLVDGDEPGFFDAPYLLVTKDDAELAAKLIADQQ